MLAQRYMSEFDRKWVRGEAPPGRAAARKRRHPVPGGHGKQLRRGEGDALDSVHPVHVVQLAGTTLLPVLPLGLTMFSAEEFLDRLLKVVF